MFRETLRLWRVECVCVLLFFAHSILFGVFFSTLGIYSILLLSEYWNVYTLYYLVAIECALKATQQLCMLPAGIRTSDNRWPRVSSFPKEFTCNLLGVWYGSMLINALIFSAINAEKKEELLIEYHWTERMATSKEARIEGGKHTNNGNYAFQILSMLQSTNSTWKWYSDLWMYKLLQFAWNWWAMNDNLSPSWLIFV